MATANRFDLLRDDDNDDVLASQQQNKSAAKLPSKPLPVKVAKSEGALRGYGRRDGGGYDRRDGGGYDRNSSGRTFQRRGGYGVPQSGFRGEHCGGYSIGEQGQRDRPRRVFERWSGTTRGNEYKCEGSGRGNWGSQTDELSRLTEKVTTECKKKVDSEKPLVEDGNKEKQGNKQGKTRKNKEKPAEPEQKEREDMLYFSRDRLIMQHFAFPEDHIIELDLRSEDPNVYSNFIDQVRCKRCIHVFRILKNGKLQFIANVGTTLGHNVELEQVGFVVRLISKDDSLDVFMERRKIYVVAFRRSPDGIWIVLRGQFKNLVKKFLKKSQLASGPTGELDILEPLQIDLGTSYKSLFKHLFKHSGPNVKVIMINRGRLIEAVRVLGMCSLNAEYGVDSEIIAGPVSDIVHSIPEAVRFPEIQKHVSDNYFKDDETASSLPDHLVDMIYTWTSASRSTLCSLLGIHNKGKDIQAVTNKCPFIKFDVERLDDTSSHLCCSSTWIQPPPAHTQDPKIPKT